MQADFQLLTFTYDVPTVEEGYTNSPIIVFHSDPAGTGHAIEIMGLYVKLAPDAAAS